VQCIILNYNKLDTSSQSIKLSRFKLFPQRIVPLNEFVVIHVQVRIAVVLVQGPV